MKRYDFCFREKTPLQPVLPQLNAMICKACAFTVEKVIGFLSHYGANFAAPSSFDDLTPPKPPPKATKLKSRGFEQPKDSELL